MTQQEPNPYNAKKSWNTGEQKEVQSANTLFFREAPASAEPVVPDADTSGEAHNFQKRYEDLRPQFDRVNQRNRELERTITELQEGKHITAPKLPETPEEIEKFKKEKPDEFNRLVSLFKYVNQQENADVIQEVSKLRETSQKLKRDEALGLIQKAHPDVFDLTRSVEFLKWIDSKSKKVQDSVFANPDDPDATIATLNSYKFEKSQADKVTESTRRNAQTGQDASNIIPTRNTGGAVEGDGKKIWSNDEAKAALRRVKDPAMLEQLVAELEVAQREGRIRQ